MPAQINRDIELLSHAKPPSCPNVSKREKILLTAIGLFIALALAPRVS